MSNYLADVTFIKKKKKKDGGLNFGQTGQNWAQN